jgi:AraC family transcriptional regulator
MVTDAIGEWKVEEYRFIEARYGAGAHMEAHHDPHYRVSVVVSGSLREQCYATNEEASALSVVTKPSDAKHSDKFGPNGAHLLSVEIPKAQLEAPDRSASLLGRWRWIHGGDAIAEIMGFITTFLKVNHRKGIDGDLITERVELLLDALAEVAPPPDNKPPLWLQRVRERLHDAYDESTSVRSFAEDAGVHPTHLTRWFRKFYGCPVTRYRHRLRVKAAANTLASTSLPLSQVALNTGFYDQSHLTRVFREQTGQTPGAFRRLVRNK